MENKMEIKFIVWNDIIALKQTLLESISHTKHIFMHHVL